MAGDHTGNRQCDLSSPIPPPVFILPYNTYQPLTKYIMYPISHEPGRFYTGIEIMRRKIPPHMNRGHGKDSHDKGENYGHHEGTTDRISKP